MFGVETRRWSEIQGKLITWLSTPRALRPEGLKTWRQFSKLTGIEVETLHRWTLLPGFWDDVFVSSRAIVGRELAEILSSLVEKAKSGNVQATKLCLSILGVHADKIEIEQSFADDQVVVVLSGAQAAQKLQENQGESQLALKAPN